MKKTFLAKRNALLSSANVSWGACALVFAVVVLLLRLVAPNAFWYVFTPVFHMSDALATRSSSLFRSFGDSAELALQNETLRNENAALTLQNLSLLQKENSLAGLRDDGHGIVAGVVARPPQSPYDTLVLAAGSSVGVEIGMEAFGEGVLPLGVVSSVEASFSRVTLFSTPRTSLNGWVGAKHLPVTLRGAGAGAFGASVSRSAGIVPGDVVFAPGPGMLPIGVVVRVDSDPTSSSVTLRIQPALNLFSLAWVELRDTGMTAFTIEP